MLDFKFWSPTEFIFGKEADHDVAALIKKHKGTKVLIHYGGGSIKKNGIYDKVVSSLEAHQIPYVGLGGVVPNPESTLVYQGIELCKKHNVDFVLAVGGGSVIDSSKAIAAGVKYDGDFLDFYAKGLPIEEALPLGTVLTIPAAGSEGNGDSVITDAATMSKRVAMSDATRPKFSALNPNNTLSLPAYQTACGITDIMAHVCERYFTNTENVQLTDRMCEGILKAVIEEAPKVLNNLNDYDARANIMWAGVVAHNDICGVGREQDWSSHALSHELSSLYGTAHGAALAVIMPAWMEYVMRDHPARFAQYAVRVWDRQYDETDSDGGAEFASGTDSVAAAKNGIRCFREFLDSLNMPRSFEDIGAKASDIPKMVERLGLIGDNKLGVLMKIGAAEAEEIYRIASVGTGD